MREVIKKFNVYTFETASKELKDKIRDTFSTDAYYGNWMMQERIETLTKFAEYIDTTLDYRIGLTPHRGEFISVTPLGSFSDTYELIAQFVREEDSCILTGMCYDDDLRDMMRSVDHDNESLNNAFNKYIKSIHKEFESMLTDEYLSEHCQANEYEFTEDGNIY